MLAVSSAKLKSDFCQVWCGCSASMPNFTMTFWGVKVKVQGQNRHTENLPLVLAEMWFNTPSTNLAIQQKQFLAWNMIPTNSRWWPARGFHSLSAFSSCLYRQFFRIDFRELLNHVQSGFHFYHLVASTHWRVINAGRARRLNNSKYTVQLMCIIN